MFDRLRDVVGARKQALAAWEREHLAWQPPTLEGGFQRRNTRVVQYPAQRLRVHDRTVLGEQELAD